MIVGTAGHIDHGKTSLVRRLTGVDTDRLKEEKARGISIDLGFAYWQLDDGRSIGFVDVPGHEGLVHNMLAGATGIDFVVLVVAADDGVMPQTREHLAIVDLLGLRRGLVALTKTDLVPAERIAEATAEVRTALAGTGLAEADILPVSAETGAGIGALKARLHAEARTSTARASDGAFRLAVDRCFTLQGLGTAVSGTVLSGEVAVDDTVMVSPAGLEARVRSIHAQDQPSRTGRAGQRCALVLTGPRISKDSVHRGMVVLAPELHAPTARIDARLRLLASEKKPVGQWMPVRLHTGASEAGARLVLIGEGDIAPGASDLVQIVLERDIAAAAGDRFVVRDTTSSRTIGGGTFLDLRAPERRRRTPERRTLLAAFEEADDGAALPAALAVPPGWLDLAAFLRDRARKPASGAGLVARLGLVALPAAGASAAGGQPVLAAATWAALAAGVAARLDAFHTASPDLPGMGIEKLRVAVTPRLPAPVFLRALARLVADGVSVLDRSWVRAPGHEVRFSAEEERLWARILPLIADVNRFRPPRVRDIGRELDVDEAIVRRLSRLAARRGDVEEVAHDHYFLYDTVSEMGGIARRLGAAEPKGFTASQFRDQLDNGRKVAIQILEFFDAHGLTMRRGDLRRINPHRANLFAPRGGGSPGSAACDSAAGSDAEKDGAGTSHAFGGVPFPVGRPDFKSGWGRQTVPGGFDSHPPPPHLPQSGPITAPSDAARPPPQAAPSRPPRPSTPQRSSKQRSSKEARR